MGLRLPNKHQTQISVMYDGQHVSQGSDWTTYVTSKETLKKLEYWEILEPKPNLYIFLYIF